MSPIRPAWVKINYVRTGVGRFRSNMHNWSLASSATCKCGADDKTADHVFLHCNIHRAPARIRDLMSLDEYTTLWLLNSCTDF